RDRGFEVERGTGKTKDKNIENVHEYKETQKKIDEKKKELQAFTEKVPVKLEVNPRRQMKQVEVESDEKNLFGMRKKEMQKEPTGNVILPENDFKKLVAAAKANEKLKGKMEKVLNTDYAKEVESLKAQNQTIYE